MRNKLACYRSALRLLRVKLLRCKLILDFIFSSVFTLVPATTTPSFRLLTFFWFRSRSSSSAVACSNLHPLLTLSLNRTNTLSSVHYNHRCGLFRFSCSFLEYTSHFFLFSLHPYDDQPPEPTAKTHENPLPQPHLFIQCFPSLSPFSYLFVLPRLLSSFIILYHIIYIILYYIILYDMILFYILLYYILLHNIHI